mmetsp:Transcript_3773/g.2975  ORF Transcript_3773/g.2975 Transcript_3773/m.2975 type:complete len:88 (+) Transcript_3773:197-460(+)
MATDRSLRNGMTVFFFFFFFFFLQLLYPSPSAFPKARPRCQASRQCRWPHSSRGCWLSNARGHEERLGDGMVRLRLLSQNGYGPLAT